MKPSDYIRNGWCQHATAETLGGFPTDSNDPEACKWCIYGAFKASGNGSIDAESWSKLKAHTGPPIAWNDAPGRTQADVIAALEAVGL